LLLIGLTDCEGPRFRAHCSQLSVCSEKLLSPRGTSHGGNRIWQSSTRWEFGHSIVIADNPWNATRGMHSARIETGGRCVHFGLSKADEIHIKKVSIVASSQQWSTAIETGTACKRKMPVFRITTDGCHFALCLASGAGPGTMSTVRNIHCEVSPSLPDAIHIKGGSFRVLNMECRTGISSISFGSTSVQYVVAQETVCFLSVSVSATIGACAGCPDGSVIDHAVLSSGYFKLLGCSGADHQGLGDEALVNSVPLLD
jgi:hypothetical protein